MTFAQTAAKGADNSNVLPHTSWLCHHQPPGSPAHPQPPTEQQYGCIRYITAAVHSSNCTWSCNTWANCPYQCTRMCHTTHRAKHTSSHAKEAATQLLISVRTHVPPLRTNCPTHQHPCIKSSSTAAHNSAHKRNLRNYCMCRTSSSFFLSKLSPGQYSVMRPRCCRARDASRS